jgi:pilus assembly protein Flp/PilA
MFKTSLSHNRASPEKGQGLVEYALILVLVAVVVVVILAILGPQINFAYLRVQGALICTSYADDFEADITAGTIPADSWLGIGDLADCVAVTTSDPPTIHKTYGPP